MTRRMRWVVAVLVVTATACSGGGDEPAASNDPSVSAPATEPAAVSEAPAAEESAPEGGAGGLVEEDFEGDSVFEVTDDEFVSTSIEGGQYLVKAKTADVYLLNPPQFRNVEGLESVAPEELSAKFADVRVEVDAELLSGDPVDTSYGVACRIQPNGEHYYFAISADGFYAIERVHGEDLNELEYLSEEGLSSDVVAEGVNRITATCQGPKLSLAVNGQELVTVEDGDYEKGTAGLSLIGLGEGLSWGFDNFTMSTQSPE